MRDTKAVQKIFDPGFRRLSGANHQGCDSPRRLQQLLLAACLCLSVLPTVTLAADYSVELIVYATLQRDTGVEQWSAPRTVPDTAASLLLGENSTRMLEGPRTLQAIADTLRRSDRYRLLLHWNWQQPGWPPTQARPVLVQIPAGSTLPVTALPLNLSKVATVVMTDTPSATDAINQTQAPLLDGTVMLVASEILQVDVDLLYRDASLAVPVRLQESRRLRSGELQYLDHPRFGVLVQVTPITTTGTAPVR